MTHHTNDGDVLSQLRARRTATEKRFELGQIVATPQALERIAKHGFNADYLIARHHSGDWGDVSEPDARKNEQALTSALDLNVLPSSGGKENILAHVGGVGLSAAKQDIKVLGSDLMPPKAAPKDLRNDSVGTSEQLAWLGKEKLAVL